MHCARVFLDGKEFWIISLFVSAKNELILKLGSVGVLHQQLEDHKF